MLGCLSRFVDREERSVRLVFVVWTIWNEKARYEELRPALILLYEREQAPDSLTRTDLCQRHTVLSTTASPEHGMQQYWRGTIPAVRRRSRHARPFTKIREPIGRSFIGAHRRILMLFLELRRRPIT